VKLLVRSFALILAATLAAGGYAFYRLTRPYAGFREPVFLDFPRGTGTRQMAGALAKGGVIEAPWEFELIRLFRSSANLQAGEYRFDRPASPLEVFDRIARGDVFYYELVVPEGKNLFEIGDLVRDLRLFSSEDFIRAARDPSMIRDLDPRAPSLEGFLFPNTYRLTRHTTIEALCRQMTGKFREVWKNLNTQADVHNTVTLASLVEKEGKLAEERPVIASVFLKRLKLGMKLDCDPTTIYAALLEGRYRGTIHRSDLANGHPYNTYQHAGLPPGPIANPGLASIRAVLEPHETNYLYFVLRPDGSGGHAFSGTLQQQEAAIREYRRGVHK